jgi:hypothetical protein
MKLDELARQSSDAARASVAHLDPPPIGETGRSRAWVPALAGVGVVALLAGGLYVIVRDRDAASPADRVLPSVVDVPRLGLADSSDWTVNMAGSFAELGGEPGRTPTFSYYGDTEADDPFAGGDLLIGAFVGGQPGTPPAPTPGADTVELRGVTATVGTGADAGLPADATSLEWDEADAGGTVTEVLVVSRSLTVDDLIEIAEGLTIDPATGTVTRGDDLGLDRLAATAGTPFGAFRGSGEGYLVVYEGAGGTDALMLSTTRGDLAGEVAVLRWWTSDVRATAIGDRPGFALGFDDSMPGMGESVVWSPVDGVVATLAHLGTTATVDLEALAAGVVELDDATWAAYRTAAQANGAGADEFDEIYGQGSGSVGDTEYTWVLGLQGTDLCVNVQTSVDGQGSCQPRAGVAPPPGSAMTIDNSFADTYADVVIAADPLVEQVVESTGSWMIARVVADGVAWFVAIGDPAVQPSFDVIVGGEVVTTLEAAVQPTVEMAPTLEGNAAAVAAGVQGMEIALSGSADEGVDWWLGRMGDDLCLVTGGAVESAHCSPPADVTVFPGVTPAQSGELSFVVLQDLPPCVEGYELEGVDALIVGSDRVDQRRYDVVVGYGTSDGWRLRLDASDGQTFVGLPQSDGTATWPEITC